MPQVWSSASPLLVDHIKLLLRPPFFFLSFFHFYLHKDLLVAFFFLFSFYIIKYWSCSMSIALTQIGLGEKTWIRRTKPNSIRKSSTKPKSKLIKYQNGSKILVYKEPKPNPIRTEIFWVPRNRFINLYINYFLDLMYIKKHPKCIDTFNLSKILENIYK